MISQEYESSSIGIEHRQAELEALYKKVFLPEAERLDIVGVTKCAPGDQEILEKARSAGNADKFNRLWSGDTSDHDGDDSRADQALCCHLAFWCGNDPTRIDRMFRQSGLYRDKWERLDYRTTTISKAISLVSQSYTDRGHLPGSREIRPRRDLLLDENQLTDMGNGSRLKLRHGQDIRYCYPWKTWVIWGGMRWKNDVTGHVHRLAKDTAKAMWAEAAALADDTQSKALARHALKSQSELRLKAMMSSAQCEVPIQPEEFDRDPWLLNCANGTLDLRTGELRPHQREDFIMKLAPVEYDPEATCPTWLAFFERIMAGNERLIAYLHKMVGYGLTGSVKEQCLFFLYGLGANGKSTFLNLMRKMLGDYAKHTPAETFMFKRGDHIPADLADLKGARVVTAVEVEDGKRFAESLLKQATGGDRQKARFLYGNFFEYDPEYKIFLAANHKPQIKGTDPAIWRRIRLIPFIVAIPEHERDQDLTQKLEAELPGILAWAVKGCLLWQQEGLGPPEEVIEATEGYRQEMDSLGNFLDECCVLLPEARTNFKSLYEEYRRWCDDMGETPRGRNDFAKKLTERGFAAVTGTGNVAVRVGIGLRQS